MDRVVFISLILLLVVRSAIAWLSFDATSRTSRDSFSLIGTRRIQDHSPSLRLQISLGDDIETSKSSKPRLQRTYLTNNKRKYQSSHLLQKRTHNAKPFHKPRRRPHMNKSPQQVERELEHALDLLRHHATQQNSTRNVTTNETTANSISVLFPTIRECNAALASFGDEGDLLRALRMLGRMRKTAILGDKLSLSLHNIPRPTLVTYSTLMSRAIRWSKPVVALRIWDLMVHGTPSSPSAVVSRSDIDLKAVNIRMNCFAKLAQPRRAEDLLQQMKSGYGPDVPKLTPNLVSYNTLLDACHRAGDLDAALAAWDDMKEASKRNVLLRPDAWTFTSLIATVARNPSISSGRNDPSMAFSLLQEMMELGIRPNGRTYSALIDVCGRCRRSDLALQGLRIMLRQRAREERKLSKQAPSERYILPEEVGAWTAAIDACGRTGRLETALRLFYAMPSFGVMPNTITCGSMTDSLLRRGRTADALEILRYMKQHSIEPSEVMYTSLMTRAEGLARKEDKQQQQHEARATETSVSASSTNEAPAIKVYTELIHSLTGHSSKLKTGDDSLLVKVFLVFQEMKAVGAQPDLACYNALLRACARAGDWEHAQEVLQQMQDAELNPNDVSWRQLLQTASQRRQSSLAEQAWAQALSYRSPRKRIDERQKKWIPSVRTVGVLVKTYLREANSIRNEDSALKESLYEKVVGLYDDILMGGKERGLDRVDIEGLLADRRMMLLILQGVVGLECSLDEKSERRKELQRSAVSILKLPCFKYWNSRTARMHWDQKRAVERAQTWLQEASKNKI